MYQSISVLEVLNSCCEQGKEKAFEFLEKFDSSDYLEVSIDRDEESQSIDRHGLAWTMDYEYDGLYRYTLVKNPEVTALNKRSIKLWDKKKASLYMEAVIDHITHGMKLKKQG